MCPFCNPKCSTTCLYCSAFAGGLVGGFFRAPEHWQAGLRRMRSQEGIILAEPGKVEEEENKMLGKEIRAAARIITERQARDTASETWNELVLPTRQRLTASGFGALGNLGGNLAASRVAVFALSFLGGRILSLHPRLRPLSIFGGPARLGAATILSALSFQGSCDRLLQEQKQIFRQYPGSQTLFLDMLDDVLEKPRSD